MVPVMDSACKFPASFTKLLIGGMKGLILVTVLLDTVPLMHIIYGIWLLQAPASAATSSKFLTFSLCRTLY